MRRMLIVIVAVGIGFLLLRLLMYLIPEAICILLTYLLGLALVIFFGISAKKGISTWRHTSDFWAMPALICLALFIVGWGIMPPIGRYIKVLWFDKNLDAYSKVVAEFRTGAISCTNSCTASMELVQVASRPARVRNIWGVHCDDGGAIVLFLLNTDVPLVHEGFFFKDFGTRSNCEVKSLAPESGWPHVPYVRHVTGQWYHWSDQPGL
jgi:hypothetical protein